MLNKKDLSKRVISAIIFGAIVIFLLNYNKDTEFIFLVLVGLGTGYEYIKIKLGGQIRPVLHIVATVLFAVYPALLQYFYSSLNSIGFVILVALSIIYSFFLIAGLFLGLNWKTENRIIVYFEVLFYIGLPVILMTKVFIQEREIQHSIIFLIILLIWINDTFAFFTGSLFGKHKLMPAISPGKTVEGFIGGGIFTLAGAWILSFFYKEFSMSFLFASAVVVWIAGTLGDLIESKLKRTYGLKDSGKIMPGHGGFLDRFDSFLFASVWVLAIYLLMYGV